MQKKLIALAIAGLSSAAFAQSNVTISGQIKTGYTNYKVSGTAANNGRINSITDQTSMFVLSGSEALGNGLSAIFRIDTRLDSDEAGTTSAAYAGGLGGGNTHVGLKGSFGEFKVGRQDLHYNETERIDAGVKTLSQQYSVGRNLMTGVTNSAGTVLTVGNGNSRTNNVVFWDSPNWSGFTARVAYSTGYQNQRDDQLSAAPLGGATAKEGNAWNVVGRYENGPLKLGVSHFRTEAAAAATAIQGESNSTKAWAGYKIAGFSFGLAFDQSKIESNGSLSAKRTAWAIPVSYQFGNHGIYASYAKAGKSKDAAGDIANSGAKQWGVGYDYAFSKRTSVGVNYTKIDNKAGSNYTFQHQGGPAGANGADYSQLYAGIRHAF